MCQIHNSGNQKYRESRPIVGSIIQSFYTKDNRMWSSVTVPSYDEYCSVLYRY